MHRQCARRSTLARDRGRADVDSGCVLVPLGSIPCLLFPDDAPSFSPDYLKRSGRPKATTFTAELDLVELDVMGRSQAIWSARAAGLSRSSIIVLSRRMIYTHRTIGVLIHLVDSKPVVLFSRAVSCEYVGNGQHVVDLDLIPIPEIGPIALWANKAAG